LCINAHVARGEAGGIGSPHAKRPSSRARQGEGMTTFVSFVNWTERGIERCLEKAE
jgi:hypothetical protein